MAIKAEFGRCKSAWPQWPASGQDDAGQGAAGQGGYGGTRYGRVALAGELGVTRQTLYRHVGPGGELRDDGKKLMSRLTKVLK